jgi:SLT domain-containing protein
MGGLDSEEKLLITIQQHCNFDNSSSLYSSSSRYDCSSGHSSSDFISSSYKRAAAAPATKATARISAAVLATTAAAATADFVMGTAVRVKAVATTAAALREQSKLSAGVRRSSARASILYQRRNSVVSDTEESPEKSREADNMNKSFVIDFEDGDL